jgi:hypothetical protein
MLCSVDWQPRSDNSAKPMGLSFKYQAAQEDGTELSVSDRQPTWHNRPDERKLQVQLIFPKNL